MKDGHRARAEIGTSKEQIATQAAKGTALRPVCSGRFEISATEGSGFGVILVCLWCKSSDVLGSNDRPLKCSTSFLNGLDFCLAAGRLSSARPDRRDRYESYRALNCSGPK